MLMIRRLLLTFLLTITLLTGFVMPSQAAGVTYDMLDIEAGNKTSINGAYPDYLYGTMFCELLYLPGSKDAHLTVGVNLRNTWASSVIKRLTLPFTFGGTIAQTGQTKTLVVNRVLGAFSNSYAIPPFKAKTVSYNTGTLTLGGNLTVPVTLTNSDVPFVTVRLFNTAKIRVGMRSQIAQNVTWFPATTRDVVETSIRKASGTGQPSVTCSLAKRRRDKTAMEQIRDTINNALKFIADNPQILPLPIPRPAPLPIPIPIPGQDML